jgi:hypothetical protein
MSQYIITIKFDSPGQDLAEDICAGIADYVYNDDHEHEPQFAVSMVVVVPATTKIVFSDAPGRGELAIQRQNFIDGEE